ncbi:MAG: Mrp/NBP35 family ATP-binding protein [Planctomycetota bacterium]
MTLTKDQIESALARIRDSETGRDIVSNGQLQKIAVCDAYVTVTLAAPDSRETRTGLQKLVEQCVARAAEDAGEPAPHQINTAFVTPSAEGAVDLVDQPKDIPLKQASSSTSARGGGHPVTPSNAVTPGVKHVVAVGAGKGGVGKSTVAVNLAVALARAGHRVGLLDGDIYGPSVPTLLGLASEQPTLLEGNLLQPFQTHGISTMTIGKLVDPEKPLIWRGPMAHGAFKQLTEQTAWGEQDYLVIDLPPGTGDVPLTMAQMFSLSGAVIVCTPQRVAQDDAVRAARMFQQLKVPILGIVENMSYFVGDEESDGTRREYDIFGRGGAEQMAQRLGLPFLGAVPITMALRANSDAGNPTANFEGDPALAGALEKLARNVENEVALASLGKQASTPTLTVA